MADKYGEVKFSLFMVAAKDMRDTYFALVEAARHNAVQGGPHDVTVSVIEPDTINNTFNVYCGGPNPAAFLTRMKAAVNVVTGQLNAVDVEREVPAKDVKTWGKCITKDDRNANRFSAARVSP